MTMTTSKQVGKKQAEKLGELFTQGLLRDMKHLPAQDVQNFIEHHGKSWQEKSVDLFRRMYIAIQTQTAQQAGCTKTYESWVIEDLKHLDLNWYESEILKWLQPIVKELYEKVKSGIGSEIRFRHMIPPCKSHIAPEILKQLGQRCVHGMDSEQLDVFLWQVNKVLEGHGDELLVIDWIKDSLIRLREIFSKWIERENWQESEKDRYRNSKLWLKN